MPVWSFWRVGCDLLKQYASVDKFNLFSSYFDTFPINNSSVLCMLACQDGSRSSVNTTLNKCL